MSDLALEKLYWSMFQSILPEEDLRPLNYESERDRFFRKGFKQSEDPQFVYRRANNEAHLSSLLKLHQDFSRLKPDFYDIYLIKINKLRHWIEFFGRRDTNFPSDLHNLYGRPEKSTVDFAREYLEKNSPIVGELETQSHDDACEHFIKILRDYNFINWSVKKLDMPSKVRISSVERTIYVDSTSNFSTAELRRLSVHEVGTHILRFENGSRQSSYLFRYGFPDYLECEEGLAILAEDKSGLLSKFDLGKYCLRVLAADACENLSFCELFTLLLNYTDMHLAYSITARIKRGLNDTRMAGGYTKDHVYLSGYLRCQRLSQNELHRLFFGKMGFREIERPMPNSFCFNDEIILPNWLNDSPALAQP